MADHHDRHIAIVGAGPRGTSVLERLCASAPELLAPGTRLTVHVVDSSPAGAGQVWRTAQPAELLMNTVASQVTLFTDHSVDCAGPIRPGPSLYEWHERRSPGALGPDDYPTRALYGRYLEWVFARILRDAPENISIRIHTDRAVGLDDAPDGSQVLELADGTRLTGLAAVVLAQGHLPAFPDPEQERLASYAATHGLRYLRPGNPADLTTELAALAPGQPVLLRGLGLTFFDHMALLTTARGGRFTDDGAGGLRYLPSGKEPRLYAGSRRGVPYHARGDNAKGPHGRHTPLLLTPDTIAQFRKRVMADDAPDFLTDVWPLVAKEVETVYYEALLAHGAGPGRGDARGPRGMRELRGFRGAFLAAPHRSAEETAVLDEFGVAASERWDWDSVSHPDTGRTFTGPAAYHGWLLARLREDIEHARLGNVDGPVKAALDVLRDLRNELRQIVDHGGLTGASRRDHLDRWYTPLNAFLSIGPPRQRIAEMAALIEAGVLTVVGPGLEVSLDTTGGFLARSPRVPGSMVRATALIEARLPEPDLRRTADPLLAALLASGVCRPHTVGGAGGYETGGVDVTQSPYRLIDAQGRPHPHRFAVGVPTEGVHWVTAAGARPGVNSVTLMDTDAIALAALRSVPKPRSPDTYDAPAHQDNSNSTPVATP
ncbi:FAD/NAD(P)-binding protein [Streptomyces gobiensis]|uniref:FAD/NAD(P)-binding protein n=1 Tax=Streptomyces gobiensis TaxID=2875706 RepID=UPI001E4A51F3|nr:FAD/NAD(P)-binding protein [Streptomyces gobiensis]UGY91161.1 FAD/NAD(P)-binding protein [Streptomyces gobiensis]